MANNPQAFAEVIKRLKQSKGFEKIFHSLKIISVGNGNCVAEYKVAEEALNTVNTLHGGFSSSLIDSVSTFALFSHERVKSPSVSVDLIVSYLKAARVGDEIIVDARTLSAGKTLGFLTVDIRNKATNELLVRGGHTKYIIRPKK